jgi:hypothetical protein
MNPRLIPSSAIPSPPHPAFEAALAHLCEVGQWDYGEIWIPTPTAKAVELHLAAHVTTHSHPATAIALEQFWDCSKGLVFAPHVGLPGRVWMSQEFEWLADATAPSEREFLRHYIAKALGLKTGLGLPLLVDRQVLAVVVLFMTRLRESDPAAIAEMIATAAQLSRQIQQVLALPRSLRL